jgi:hypothetical protein
VRFFNEGSLSEEGHPADELVAVHLVGAVEVVEVEDLTLKQLPCLRPRCFLVSGTSSVSSCSVARCCPQGSC